MQKLEKSCTNPHGNSHDDTLTHTCKQKYKKIEILGSIDNFIMSHDFVTHGIYHISGAMVKLFASNAVDRGFKPWLGQTKDYKIGISYFLFADFADFYTH